jgi:hypothetical protein
MINPHEQLIKMSELFQLPSDSPVRYSYEVHGYLGFLPMIANEKCLFVNPIVFKSPGRPYSYIMGPRPGVRIEAPTTSRASMDDTKYYVPKDWDGSPVGYCESASLLNFWPRSAVTIRVATVEEVEAFFNAGYTRDKFQPFTNQPFTIADRDERITLQLERNCFTGPELEVEDSP